MQKILYLAVAITPHLAATSVPVTPVPEPSTMLLTAGGLIGAIWLLRRKRGQR